MLNSNKYTFEMFMNGEYGIKTNTQFDVEYLLGLLEKLGVKWLNGNPLSMRPQFNGEYRFKIVCINNKTGLAFRRWKPELNGEMPIVNIESDELNLISHLKYDELLKVICRNR